MTTEREMLAENFARARAAGLLDIKFFAFVDEETTVESLCAAANKVDRAIRDNLVSPFVVDDEGMVADSIDDLLY